MVWGASLVQAADQEAQAQLAFSTCEARAWCKLRNQEAQAQLTFSTFGASPWFKLQIKRPRPNSRFEHVERVLGASCRSRGSGPTRVFNVWGEGLVQAANQEAQAQLASSTDGARARSKVHIKRLKPNSRFHRLRRGLGASCRSRGSGPTRIFSVWCEGLVQAADQEAQAQLASSTDGMRAGCKVQIKRLRPSSRFEHVERGLSASCRSRGSGSTRVLNVWGEGLVQGTGQEAQAQRAFSMFGVRAWCKLQIKSLKPISRFQRLG